MSKKKPIPTVSMPGLGSEFDDLFKDPVSDQSTNTDQINDEPGDSTQSTPPSAASSTPQPKRKASKPVAKKPRKKKAEAAAVSEQSSVATPPPPSTFSRDELDWFFSNPAGIADPKQLYVSESTKETLHHVAKATGVPVGHLTDNLVRWFLLSNKAELIKIISRNRDPFGRLDA